MQRQHTTPSNEDQRTTHHRLPAFEIQTIMERGHFNPDAGETTPTSWPSTLEFLLNPESPTRQDIRLQSPSSNCHPTPQQTALRTRQRNALRSPLLRLPQELQDMIISHTLSPYPTLTITHDLFLQPQTPPLTRTCHALRDPTAALWFRHTDFRTRSCRQCPEMQQSDKFSDFQYCYLYRRGPCNFWLGRLEARHRLLIRRLWWYSRVIFLMDSEREISEYVGEQLGVGKGVVSVNGVPEIGPWLERES
jgi:hypothetical protein